MAVRYRLAIGLSVTFGLLLVFFSSAASNKIHSSSSRFKSSSSSEKEQLLRGNSTVGLFERLMPDVTYITSGRQAGLTNQVMAAINLVYLSTLTNRVPIFPPFHANNQLSKTPIPDLPVSSMFDIARMSDELETLRGVLEWGDIVTDKGVEKPKLGCWGGRRKGDAVDFTGAKVSWTDLPGLTLTAKARYMAWVHFVPYLTPSSPFYHRFVATKVPKDAVPPNDQLACLDETMDGTDLGDMGPYNEYALGFGGWMYAGKYLRWRQALVDQARMRVRKAFVVPAGEEVPPFVVMHIRHGDFTDFCEKGTPCFTPSQFAFQLDLLKKELVAAGRPVPTNVLVMTDESDPKFFAEVKARGWKTSADGEGVESSALVEELGGWYDTLIDNVLLSQGDHFIGTISSTMSLLGSLRTKDWNGGLSKMVGFKFPELALP